MDTVTKRIKGCANVSNGKKYEEKNLQELQALCEPVVQYLRKTDYPYGTIIVTCDGITQLESVMGIPIPYKAEELD